MADSIATTVGAILGTSTTTTYVESAAGVAQGGRSGLTDLIVGGCSCPDYRRIAYDGTGKEHTFR